MGTRRLLILEIGASHVSAARFALKAGRMSLEEFACETHCAERPPEEKQNEGVAASLLRLGRRGNFAGDCVLVPPGHLVLTKCVLASAPSTAPQIHRAASAAADHIPLPLAEVAWGHRILSGQGSDLEMLLVAMRRTALDALCDAAGAAGFRCVHALPATVALWEAFRFTHPAVKEPFALADIGARTTQLLLGHAGNVHLRTVDLGGNAITEAVAGELGIGYAAAEALKREVHAGGQASFAPSPGGLAVRRASEAFGVRFLIELRRTAASWSRRGEIAAPLVLYLSGNGAKVAGLAEMIAEQAGLRVERYDPGRKVEMAAPLADAGSEVASNCSVAAVGAAAHFLTAPDSGTNLLPPEVKRAIARERRKPVWLTAAAMLAGGFFLPVYYYHQRAAAARVEAKILEHQIAPLRAWRAQDETHRREIEAATRRLAALTPAWEARQSWVNFLAALQARLIAVEDIWLDRMEIDLKPSAGLAPDEAREGGPVRLLLSGRLIDVEPPQASVSPHTFERVKQLLEQLRGLPSVAAVVGERFDNPQDALLRFECSLVLDARRPL